MPVEVRELVIKATVTSEGTNGGTKSSSSGSSGSGEEIINTCVEKVLEILKEKNGR